MLGRGDEPKVVTATEETAPFAICTGSAEREVCRACAIQAGELCGE